MGKNGMSFNPTSQRRRSGRIAPVEQADARKPDRHVDGQRVQDRIRLLRALGSFTSSASTKQNLNGIARVRARMRSTRLRYRAPGVREAFAASHAKADSRSVNIWMSLSLIAVIWCTTP